jgi:flagellar assembly protein FliH
MQSSYRIIKDTVINKSKTVAPPPPPKVRKEQKIEEPIVLKTDENPELIKAMEEKELILNDAKNKAKEIIANTNSKMQQFKKKSEQEGYQEGYKKGYKEGYDFGEKQVKEETKKLRADAEQFVSNCHEESRKYINDCRDEIIMLAVDIARKIINTEITVNTNAIYRIAENVISKAVDKKQIILKVNPADFNIIKNRKDELSIYVEDTSNIIVIADSSISHGSIMAETPSGFIDGDIENQLKLAADGLIKNDKC